MPMRMVPPSSRLHGRIQTTVVRREYRRMRASDLMTPGVGGMLRTKCPSVGKRDENHALLSFAGYALAFLCGCSLFGERFTQPLLSARCCTQRNEP